MGGPSYRPGLTSIAGGMPLTSMESADHQFWTWVHERRHK